MTFKSVEWDSARMGKKAKRENCQTVRSRGHTSAYLKVGNQPWTFKGIKAEKRERMKKQEIEPAE